MRKFTQLFFILVLTQGLISCASMMAFMFDDKKVEQFALQTDPIEIQSSLQWAVERLSETDEDSPNLVATLIPITVEKANLIDLMNTDAALYSALTDRLVSIAKEGMPTSDPEEWTEDGFPYSVTSDYLRASAAYNLGQLEGDTIASQLLVILRKVDSPGVQTVVIKSMLQRSDSYKKTPEFQAQAVTALSSVNIANFATHSELSELVYEIENELVDLSIINRILTKIDIYQLSERNLNYILDVNEGLYIHYLNNPDKINKSELIKNSSLLSALILPKKAQFDGILPTFSAVQKSAQRLLLQYVPGLYYYSMYENAKISDYSLGQLMATLAYVDRYDQYAKDSKAKLVVKGDEGTLFFNHHQIANERLYPQTREKAKKLVFSSLSKRIEERPYEYIDFMYSFLNLNYPADFAKYLLSATKLKYNSVELDQLQHYYALHLTKDGQVKKATQKGLIANISAAQLTRSLKYDADDYRQYVDKVMPIYIENQSIALLTAYTKRNASLTKQAGVSALVDYYIAALEKQPLTSRSRYLAPVGQVIAMRNPVDSKKVYGSLMALPLQDTVAMFERYAYANTKSTLLHDYLYYSNYLTKHKKTMTDDLSSRFTEIYKRGVLNAGNEDASLYAAQQAMASLSASKDLQQIQSAVKGRYKNINTNI